MLKNLVECKLPANFLIIEDREEAGGQELFSAFLKNCEPDNWIKQINLICYENPPEYYFSKKIVNDKIVSYNFIEGPCHWNNSNPKRNLHLFTSEPEGLSETAFFIDSLSLLIHHEGFVTTCRNLNILKKYSKKFVCVVHGDVLSFKQLEELTFFSSAFIKIKDVFNNRNSKEKICEVTYKKSGGKILKQSNLFSISDDLRVTCSIQKTKDFISSDLKREIESLTTFKLGLHISEKEKKARDELVLPYLKIETENQIGKIIYQPEIDELEEDPDDDLDI